jgi:hypothetical protein
MQAYRQSNASDCGELTWDDGLAAMAYACARMMAEAGEGEACQGTSEDRARDAGVANEFATFAEATRTHAKLDVLVQGLETDRFNRFYLEECDYTKVGSGIAGNAEDGYWMVSTYGQPAD